jgi:hypothetical protein
LIFATNGDGGPNTRSLHNGTQFSSCCGSRVLTPPLNIPKEGTVTRKWKNQYGEGVTVVKYGGLSSYNSFGILLIEGCIGSEVNDDAEEVKHIKTKNGNLTVAVRKGW